MMNCFVSAYLTNTLQFSMWSHDVVATSIGLASDLKVGQYLKIPPRVMFLTQVWGTIIGESGLNTASDPQRDNLFAQARSSITASLRVMSRRLPAYPL